MQTRDILVALDQGTTSSRALLFSTEGRCLGMAQQDVPQQYPHPGWVEQSAHDIWRSQLATLTEALATAGIKPARVAAVGIANQRETTLVWDRATGEPLHPAIVWQCRRTRELCRELIDAGAADLVRSRTGLEIDAYFSGTKLRWILDRIDPQRQRAARGELVFGTVDAWLLWNLTGGRVHATDVTNASRTMLCDIHTGQWSDELLELLSIPRAVLPEIRASNAYFGEVTVLPGAMPIHAVLGDQQSALFGQACHATGMAKCTYGTGCFLLQQTGPQAQSSSHRLLTTPAWRVGEQTSYALEGSVFMGGATLQWLRDGVGILDDVADSADIAASVGTTDGVYLVPAFAGLGAPYWDMEARGMLCGMTRGTDRRHLIRAALESIAFRTRDLLQAMQADAGCALDALRVDGGAALNDVLMQFQADLLDVPVQRPQVTETTALGAALMAGLGVGIWHTAQETAACWSLQQEFLPQMSETQRNALCDGWAEAVSRARSG